MNVLSPDAAAAPSSIMLPLARIADPARRSLQSFDPEIGVVHHLGPLFHLQLDAGGELVGRIGDRLEAQAREPLLDVGTCDGLGDPAGKQIDDLFWRTRRRYDAGQRIGLEILDALLRERRHVGHLLRALCRRDADRTYLTGLD